MTDYIKITKCPYWLAKQNGIPNKIVLGELIRETEKAVNILQSEPDFMETKNMWFPKSKIEYEIISFDEYCVGMVKLWKVDIKEQRLSQSMARQQEIIGNEKERIEIAYGKIDKNDWEIITKIAKKLNAKFDVHGLNQYNKPIMSFTNVESDYWIRLEGITELHMMDYYVTGNNEKLDRTREQKINSLEYYLHGRDRNHTSRGELPKELIERLVNEQ